jgi:outer membrane receptor protein involved in Fe transport
MFRYGKETNFPFPIYWQTRGVPNGSVEKQQGGNEMINLRLGILTMACAVLLLGQLDRGTISGLVKDPSAAVVPATKVTATHSETNTVYSSTSTESGNYTLAGLPAGKYQLTAEAPGFKRTVFPSVTVTAGSTINIDLKLEVGGVAESVEVVERVTAIDVSTARVATNVTSKLVENLPLVVAGKIRSVFDLAVLAPETKTGSGFRIGGGQGASYDMLMDGSSVSTASSNYQNERAPLDAVSVDSISEFSVEYTGMKAEFGRAMGVISFVTKSGTNSLHGSAYEFFRNNALDARGFFAATTPVLKQNNFGGTLGGPVIIPKLYNGKDKTFFFVNYEGFRSRAGSDPRYMTVPLEEMYQGDFTGWVTQAGAQIPIYDPATTQPNPNGTGSIRTPFPGNKIPASRFSQVAKNYLSIRPPEMTPNVPGSGPRNNYFRSDGGQTNPWNKYSVKIDHNLSSADRLSFLWLDNKWETLDLAQGPPGLPCPFCGLNNWLRKNRAGRFSWSRTFSPRVLNSFRFSYNRDMGDVITSTAVDPDANWGAKMGIKNDDPTLDRGLPPITFTDYTGWSAAAFGFDRGRDLHMAEDVTMTSGAHTFKTGFFYQGDRWDGGGQHRNNGAFGFSQLATSIPGDQSRNTGNAFASFLLGYVDSAGLETRRNVIQKWSYLGGYFQDDWRVSSKLTLNLGIRYEYTIPVRGGAEIVGDSNEADGFSNFSPTARNPAAGGIAGGMVFTGEGAGRLGTNEPFPGYKWAFSPRVGIAYQARPGTVVRLNGGRSFAALKTTGGSTHYDGFIGNYSWSSTDQNIANFPTMLDDGLPYWPPPPFLRADVSNNQATVDWWMDTAGRPSEYWTYGMDIQQQLPGNSVFTLGYTGTKGTYLNSGIINLNQISPSYLTAPGFGPNVLRSPLSTPAGAATGVPRPYPTFNGTVQQALQLFPQFRQINGNNGGEKVGNSTYHAMTLKFDKRYSSGLTILGSYVFSKMFTDAETASVGGELSMDTYNRTLEKALSANDQTHMFRTSFNYEFPLGKGKSVDLGGFGNAVLGGWSMSGFLDYSSGYPMNVSPGLTPPLYPGSGANRATIDSYDNWRAPVSGEKFDPFKDVWWNKSAFQQRPQAVLETTLGNATRRNPKARQPWMLNENLSLAKSFPFGEQLRVDLRGEFFNLFNRVRWGDPDGAWTSGNFGVIRSQANSPRQLQIGLKVIF